MKGITDFFHSEKGLWGFLVPMIGATAMLIQGSVDAQQWMDFAKVLAGIYVGGKSIQGGAQALANARQAAAGAREGLAELEATVKKNDAIVDELVAELAKEKKRYAASAEG